MGELVVDGAPRPDLYRSPLQVGEIPTDVRCQVSVAQANVAGAR
jgi:hypothetical protein